MAERKTINPISQPTVYKKILPLPTRSAPPVPAVASEVSIRTTDFTELPRSYNYVKSKQKMRNEGSWKVYIQINTSEGLLRWLKEYEDMSTTTWRVLKTYPSWDKRHTFKRDYRCQHNTKPRSSTADTKRLSKNFGCPASLYLSLLKDTVISGNERLIESGYFASVTFSRTHNHNLNVPETLKFRDVKEETKQRLIKLFLTGHSPNSAAVVLRDDITKGLDSKEAALKLNDRSICPDSKYINRLYSKNFNLVKAGQAVDSTVTLNTLYQNIELINQECKMECAKLVHFKGKIVMAICTPLMKRVHLNWSMSSRIVFMFASSPYDGYSIYFLYTPWLDEALPLGCFMTQENSMETLVHGLKTLLTIINRPFYGAKSPVAFITDNNTKQRDALRTVFPNSLVQASTVELTQDFWRWVQNEGIDMADKDTASSMIKTMLTATSKDEVNQAYTEFGLRFPEHAQLLEYVTQIYESSNEWFVEPLANCIPHFDVIVNLWKDNVLHQMADGTSVYALDYLVSTFSASYGWKLQCVVNNSRKEPTQRKKQKTRSVIENIMGSAYSVTDVKEGPAICDMNLFVCTCATSKFGDICQHQKECRKQLICRSNVQHYECGPEEKRLFTLIAIGEYTTDHSDEMTSTEPETGLTDNRDLTIKRKQTLCTRIDTFAKRLKTLANKNCIGSVAKFLDDMEKTTDSKLASHLGFFANKHIFKLDAEVYDPIPPDSESSILVKTNSTTASISITKDY